MATKATVRDTQTQVKHQILQQYLRAWGAIIVSGLKGRFSRAHFVYVDCFASTGRYDTDREDHVAARTTPPVYGSAVIGVRELDDLVKFAQRYGIQLTTSAILVERDVTRYQALRGTLTELKMAPRIRETDDFASLMPGDIALVNANSIDIADKLLSYTSAGKKFAFYLLDPFGPSGIPYHFVKRVVSQERHDVMINLVYEALNRHAGIGIKPVLSAAEQQTVDYWANAFGAPVWDKLMLDMKTPRSEESIVDEVLGGVSSADDVCPGNLGPNDISSLKEWRFVSAYERTLGSMDSTLTTKFVGLLFPAKQRTMMYLFLTTHDPTGALALNKALYDAKVLENELRTRLRIARCIPPDQLSLFASEQDDNASSSGARRKRPSVEDVATAILRRLKAGTTVTRKQIYMEFADDYFFPEEINKALHHLRSIGRVAYTDTQLRQSTRITVV